MSIRRLLLFSIGCALLGVTALAADATAPRRWQQAGANGPAQGTPPQRQQQTAPADGVERITLDDFKALIAGREPVTIIDVRYQIDEKIKGAIHIPMGEIESRLGEIPRDREIITYCA